MDRPKNYYRDTYHHIYNRGANRDRIFFDDKDYEYFVKRMAHYMEKYRIALVCYCLMPNHFHLFVRQQSEGSTVGKFVGDLTNSYTKATNKRYQRSGVLFEGPTKAKPVEDPGHFAWLIKYILMNPVKAKLVRKPQEWKYSSAREYFDRQNGSLIDKEIILSQFGSSSEFQLFIEEPDDHFDYNVFF